MDRGRLGPASSEWELVGWADSDRPPGLRKDLGPSVKMGSEGRGSEG